VWTKGGSDRLTLAGMYAGVVLSTIGLVARRRRVVL